VSGHSALPNQVAHPTPGRARPRSRSATNRKWSLHPMGGPCDAARCFQHASNAQAGATHRPGTDCHEPTRGAPDRCVKEGVPHSAVPPRRKRTDGPLGERGRRPRTHCRTAASAAAVTLAHEREPPESRPWKTTRRTRRFSRFRFRGGSRVEPVAKAHVRRVTLRRRRVGPGSIRPRSPTCRDSWVPPHAHMHLCADMSSPRHGRS
jgi:hypothetical protein